MAMPLHIVTHRADSSGVGIHADATFTAADEVFRVKRPLVAALDSPHLQDTCSNCFRWLPSRDGNETQSTSGTGQTTGSDSSEATLKNCLGCKVVKYCCKECQVESWKDGHRYECSKIFAKLYPKVLPNTVRLVIGLLLRRGNQSLSDDDWKAFLGLRSHVQDFKSEQSNDEEGLTSWQTIELMAQATASYSGTKEPIQNIQNMIARVMINAHTLITATLDPLGLYLSPVSALLNHSCEPNAYITFVGPSLTLRTLAPVAAGTELVISYIDTTNRTPTRQSELRSRYFFTCVCIACVRKSTNGQFDDPLDPQFERLAFRALELQQQAAKSNPSGATAIITEALALLERYPLHQQPYPSILHNGFLNAIATRSWSLALKYALRAYFHIEPIHYQLTWHPVRIVRKWILLRLVVQIAGLTSEEDKTSIALGNLGVDWRVVAQGLCKEIGSGVIKSHGHDDSFTTEVRVYRDGIGVGEGGLVPEIIEEEWRKLRSITDEGSQTSKD